ncbi:MAG: hypothetical protein U1D55_08245 [Phycisphaerae bacterium]
MQRVLDVGNCDPDHGAISAMLRREFDVVIDRVMFVHEALQAMRQTQYALVLVNRRIFADDSDGMRLVTAMKADAALFGAPVMLISNFPEAQQRAVEAGAETGFGKAELADAGTAEHLARYLPRKRVLQSG